MATSAEPSGVPCPSNVDSLSFVPTITGDAVSQAEHDYLYGEFYEQGGKQAVRAGNWKAIRMPWMTGKTKLYDLGNDIGEANDIASKHPDTVKRLEAMMAEAHTEHPNWQVRGQVEN